MTILNDIEQEVNSIEHDGGSDEPDRSEVMSNLEDLVVPVSTYGTGTSLSVPLSDGIGSYELGRIRDEGYAPKYYDEVNDELVLVPKDEL